MNEEIGTRIVCAAVNVKWPDGKKIQLIRRCGGDDADGGTQTRAQGKGNNQST